ncbi:ATP-binding protein [Faecalimonas sp.]
MMKLVLSYIKEKRKNVLIFLFCAMQIKIFAFLYGLNSADINYALFICGISVAVIAVIDLIKYIEKYKKLAYLKRQLEYELGEFPEAKGLLENTYQEMVSELYISRKNLVSSMDISAKEAEEYYMLWAHQIKTPISAMHLLLQSGEVDCKILSIELFKIEQYVEMVLHYLREKQMSQDMVLNYYSLSEVIKTAIKKYSKLFILQKIKLNFEPMEVIVLTDEKWLLFAVEQIISNALKYTKAGSVSIYIDKTNENLLVIEDTGIGISAEDLPRVVEKGFTGYNGRSNHKSTGLGLYLTKEVLNKLGHRLLLESQVGKGTKVIIDFNRE